MSSTVLDAGRTLAAEGAVECPNCEKAIGIPIRMSIENLLPMSMVLLLHPDPVVCPHCRTPMVPLIQAIDTKAIRWGMSLVNAPEAQKKILGPNEVDVTKILMQK
jgi:hypothetical protein